MPPFRPPPANQACTLLTTAEAASIIGAGGKGISISSAPTGASCLIQNGDKLFTVLEATLASEDAAAGRWNAKKRVVSGDLAGWPTKAYPGSPRAVRRSTHRLTTLIRTA